MKRTIVILSLIIMVISVKAQINFNNNTINAQNYSSAIGEQNTSTGLSSFASGKLNASEGSYSISLGYGISATGNSSFGAGLYNSLSGGYSIGIGNYLSATQTKSFIIGSGYNYSNPMVNNIPNSLMVGFGSTKPTFFVSTATASDKTGKIGIGDITSPGAKLHIKSDYGEEAVLLIEPNIWNNDGWAEIRVGNGSNAVKGSYTYGLQLKTDKNYLFDSPNAKVGIGTSSPAEKLEVSGNIKASGTGYMMTSKVQAIDNNGLSLYGTASTGIMVMNDGKVGIGTNLPGEKLEVNGKVKSTSLQITTGFANGKLLQSDASGNAVWTDPAWTISGSNVYKSAGNVGIGTPATSNRLEVSGTVNATNFTGNGSGLTAATDYRWKSDYSGLITTNGSVIVGINNYTGTIQDDITITDPQFEVRSAFENNRKSANFVDSDGRRIFFVPLLTDWGYNPISSDYDAGIFWSDGLLAGQKTRMPDLQ
ncbi:MAG: hypothetical protein FJY07_02415 [Bacteroidetes bacterium]|nr:hypothetical protein [Bacteroidota bacterium]